MTIEQKRREFFERIAAGSGWSIAPKQDRLRGIVEPRQYHSPATQMAWEGFSAALDAVVIELPGDKPMSHNHEREAARLAYNDAIEDCRAAIEQAGLGLKVMP